MAAVEGEAADVGGGGGGVEEDGLGIAGGDEGAEGGADLSGGGRGVVDREGEDWGGGPWDGRDAMGGWP